MTPNILFLDLDRTLFDTDLFMREFWHAIGKQYKIDPIHQLAQLSSWYRPVGKLGYYAVNEHVRAVLGEPVAKVGEAIRSQLQTTNYLYPDTSHITQWQKRGDYQLRILTFGREWLQTYKLSFAPGLQSLALDIILEAKGAFIAHNFKNARGFLIDDKRNTDLPPSVKEVWINRVTDMDNPNTLTIHSLSEVEKIL